MLVLLCDAYDVEKLDDGEERVVLHFHPSVAPVKAAVLPLVKKGKVKEVAESIFQNLITRFNVEYDETQSIGKRYRRQDELGTPYCITVDFDTIGEGDDVDLSKKGKVTVRDRDTMKQELVAIEDLEDWLAKRVR